MKTNYKQSQAAPHAKPIFTVSRNGPESKNKQGVILAGGQTGRAGVVLPARHG